MITVKRDIRADRVSEIIQIQHARDEREQRDKLHHLLFCRTTTISNHQYSGSSAREERERKKNKSAR